MAWLLGSWDDRMIWPENMPIGMIWLLLSSSEASLGLLRSVTWAAQKKLKTLENAVFELPDGSGRAAALLTPRREVLWAENHPNHGMISARVGMIRAKSS